MTKRGTLAFQRAVGSAADSLWRAARRRPKPPAAEPRVSTPPSPGNAWDSIDAFYGDGELGERRRRSGEVDFGNFWREGRDYGPFWRVSLVVDTGELYALCLAHPSWAPEGGRVRLLAVGLSREEAEARLDGWGEACGQPCSAQWLDNRLALPKAVRA